MEYESTAYASYLLLSPVILVGKDRKSVLRSYGEEVKQSFGEIAEHSNFSFEALEVDQDHLHCLLKSKPGLSLVAIVRRLK